jgi:hypothetical protein
VQGVGRSAVTLAIDPKHHWNAKELRKLAVALEGVARVLLLDACGDLPEQSRIK